MTTHDDASTAQLAPLRDQDFKRVLVVVAHPDDAEYGTSAAVSMWTERGVEVGYVLATAGEAGMQRPPEEARRIRAQEQRDACEIVGVEHLRILDFPDGLVEYGVELRRAIAGEIRAFQPDVVISGAGELAVPGVWTTPTTEPLGSPRSMPCGMPGTSGFSPNNSTSMSRRGRLQRSY